MSSRIFNLIFCSLVVLANVVEARTFPRHESFHNPDRQRDFDAVQHFVNSRRTIPLDEKEGFLKISGDLRAEAVYRRVTVNTLSVPTKIIPNPSVFGGRKAFEKKDFDAEINLKIAYRCNRTEAFAKIFFDGSYGIDGSPKTNAQDPNGMFGSSDSIDYIAIKECWVSHIFYECDGNKTKVFLGRCSLDKLFKSRLQFNSRFNGFMVNHTHVFKPHWNIYGQAAAFVVDERSNHYAYVGEVGTLDFFESKIDVIYNLIYWKKHGLNRAAVFSPNDQTNPRGAQFINSQIWLAYNFPSLEIPYLCSKEAKIYGSFIYNHAAHKRVETFYKNENIAFDVGFIYGGSVEKQNDWSIEAQYQYVQAQAIPDADMAGIGRGNFDRNTFTADGRGTTNFQGYKIMFITAITDSLVVEAGYQESWQLKKALGGYNHFNKLSVEFIQAF